MFRLRSNWPCAPMCGTNSNTHASSELDSSSDGRLSSLGRMWLGRYSGPLFYTFSLPLFRVTCFQRFLRFATVLFIRATCPRIDVPLFHLYRTKSMRAP